MSLATMLVEPAAAPPGAGRARPDDPVGGGVMWLVLVVVILTAWLVVAARRRAGQAGRPGGLRSVPGGAGVGNALHDLASVLQPDRPDAAVIQRLEEQGQHDPRGDGRDPERIDVGRGRR